MKFYTGTGDKGETGLADGARLKKTDLRTAAIGEVDELNSFVGLAKCRCSSDEEKLLFSEVQRNLFAIGAVLARANIEFGKQRVEKLEKAIEEIGAELPQLRNFVLPGGTEHAAVLHICRSVCRRAERAVIKLGEKEAVNENVQIYLNRLSSLFFALALKANKDARMEEEKWSSE